MFVLCKGSEQVKDELAERAGGIKLRLCQGTEPYLPLGQHRHNVSQVSGRRKPQPKKSNCPVIGRLVYRNRALS
jgi:hypothetical protein